MISFLKDSILFLSLYAPALKLPDFLWFRLRWINNDNNYGFDFGLVKCLTKEPLMAYIPKTKIHKFVVGFQIKYANNAK